MGAPPLVGRAGELASIEADIGRAGPGCRVILVSGEPGIGKTRLVHEVVGKARAGDALVLEGRGDPLGAATAYAPLVEALGRSLRGLGEKRRAQLVDGLPELRRLFVTIGAPPPAPSGDPQLEKTRLFEALAQLVERLAADGLLVLVIDDLHWADRATFEVLHHLVRRVEEARVVVLATSRSDPAEAAEGFSALVASLRRAGRLHEVALDRLGADDTLAIARGILGDASPLGLRELIERAAGVPLFVETLVRGLVEDGRLVPGPLGWALIGKSEPGELPAVVREMLAARLARLDDDERRVIEALAVAGGHLAHDALVALVALGLVDGSHLDSAIGRLRRAALLVEDDAGEVSYSAGHPLVLEVAYSALGAAVRRQLHCALVDVLEQRGAPPERLARHYRGAGPEVDAERALAVLIAAADRAFDVGADEDAAQHLAGAVALLRPVGGERLAKVLERLGVAWQRAGKGTAALAVWQEALALVGADAIAIARLHHRIGGVEFDRGQLAAARVAYAAALDALGDQVVGELAAIHRSRAQLFDRMGDLDALGAVADALSQLAEARSSPTARVAACLVRARVHFGRYEYAAARAQLDEAAAAAGDQERLQIEIEELGLLVAIECGDLAAVREHVERVIALAGRSGTPASHVRALGYLATAQLFAGAWPDADRTLATILTLSRRFSIPRAEARVRGMIGIVACFRGDLATAAARLAEGRALAAEQQGDRYLDASFAMAEWWLDTERDNRGRPSEDLERRLSAPGDMSCWRRLCRAELAASEGRTDDALAIASTLAAIDPGPFHQAAAARSEAAALAAQGDHAGASTARERAAASWDAAGMPFEAARDRLRATMGADADASAMPRAIEAARACLATFEQLGATRWADRARKRLRELGERPAPVRRAGPGGGPLSRRELEVALLYAEGMSTAQVAERLVISPHTAATHLQRIYQRLGINSRAALTRFLVDTGLV